MAEHQVPKDPIDRSAKRFRWPFPDEVGIAIDVSDVYVHTIEALLHPSSWCTVRAVRSTGRNS